LADSVGQHGGGSLIRLMLEARRDAGVDPPRFHLAGHSFGCKVAIAARVQLVETLGRSGLLDNVRIDVALLQAAFDNDALEPGWSYGHLFSDLTK
jgi:hypothetical protein